jgi:DNA helicase II / ATP-dependent DNA helicase PcrA
MVCVCLNTWYVYKCSKPQKPVNLATHPDLRSKKLYFWPFFDYAVQCRDMQYLDSLNAKQKEAALCTEGPLLIIAGAGAGKTKTLTFRILHLIEKGVHPRKILAITFTNKAAKEMRERVGHLLSQYFPNDDWAAVSPFLSTFHSLGVFIIKNEYQTLGIKKFFTIFDRSDSVSLIKKIMKNKGIDAKQFDPKSFISHIGRAKSDMIEFEQYEADAQGDFIKEQVAVVWKDYRDQMRKENALDFDDLLYEAVLLLKKNPMIKEKYQNMFDYVHIDEYQDTNEVQYQLSKMLVEKHKNLCVVGDADQNIYSWRGATIKNILNFEHDYPDATEVLLEQNYRSTKTIIAAANDVIRKNKRRKDKNLFTENADGDKMTLFNGYDENDEARFVIDEMRNLHEKGVKYKDMAVLYRANYQSRVFEETAIRKGVPYQIAGTRFFDRREIKDVLSYVKYALNPDDFTSLSRIINLPARGIGKVSEMKIVEGNAQQLSGKARDAYLSFETLIARIRSQIGKFPVSEILKFIFEHSGLEMEYLKDREEGMDRVQNVKELVSLSTSYDSEITQENLFKFIEDVSLYSDQDDISEEIDSVRLMTIHASKGLEFDYVFIVGLEQGLFPSESFDTNKDEEEERRLFYVAITRAGKKLYLSYAGMRKMYGSLIVNTPSEFLLDIAEEYMEIYNDEPRYGVDRKGGDDTSSLAKSIFIDF